MKTPPFSLRVIESLQSYVWASLVSPCWPQLLLVVSCSQVAPLTFLKHTRNAPACGPLLQLCLRLVLFPLYLYHSSPLLCMFAQMLLSSWGCPDLLEAAHHLHSWPLQSLISSIPEGTSGGRQGLCSFGSVMYPRAWNNVWHIREGIQKCRINCWIINSFYV